MNFNPDGTVELSRLDCIKAIRTFTTESSVEQPATWQHLVDGRKYQSQVAWQYIGVRVCDLEVKSLLCRRGYPRVLIKCCDLLHPSPFNSHVTAHHWSRLSDEQ